MVEVMRDHGLPTREAPVWAWQGEPDEATICDVGALLLSSASKNHDLRVLILEVPSHRTFLTDYTQWQDFYLEDRFLVPDRPHPWRNGHNLRAPSDPEQPAQVTLPYLLPEWVLDDRHLPPCLHHSRSTEPTPSILNPDLPGDAVGI